MSPSRISSPLFVAGASLLLASWGAASPITGKYNDHPGDGYAPPRGVYSVGSSAEFQRNGSGNPTAPGSGLAVAHSTLLVNGGLFKNNNGYGLSAQSGSETVVNGGTFQDNFRGLLVNDRSHAVINGGTFANKDVNVLVFDHSRIAVNKGSFNCFGDIFNSQPTAPGLLLAQNSFGIVSGGDFEGHGSPFSVGVYALSGSSLIIKNGFFRYIVRAVSLFDATSVISGGTFGFYSVAPPSDVLNGSTGTFSCSSKLWVTGGTFAGNNIGLIATIHPGRGGTTLIDGGNFDRNYRSGVEGIAAKGSPTQITINGGNFSENGTPLPAFGTQGMDDVAGGVLLTDGTKAVINGGRFRANFPAGLTALAPGTFVKINNGDFRGNGKSMFPGGPLFGKGAYIHSGATAVINDGNFSNNDIGLQVGLTIPPTDQTLAAGGNATINGGVFHNNFGAVFARSGSHCDVQGGDFSAQYGVVATSLTNASRVRIFGGTFHSRDCDFMARSNSVIELTGVFDGYDNSHGAIVLPPGQGILTGQLKLSATRQRFSYKGVSSGKIILHPTNSPVPVVTPAPSGGSA